MPKQSAGLLIYRIHNKVLEVLLVHPGGPFWAKKDKEAWSIPKGEFTEEENPLDAAIREVEEEIGLTGLSGFIELTPVKLKSGKVIHAWATESDFNSSDVVSNTFEMEWPPKSGVKQSFPEVDKAEWFSVEEAREKINPGQMPLITELAKIIG